MSEQQAKTNEKIKQLSYLQRLQQPNSEKNFEELQHQSDQAKLQLQADILSTKKSLKEAERELEAAKSAVPFDVENIMGLKDEVEGLVRGLEALKDLEFELF